MKFSSLAVPEAATTTTSSAIRDENFIKITFPFKYGVLLVPGQTKSNLDPPTPASLVEIIPLINNYGDYDFAFC